MKSVVEAQLALNEILQTLAENQNKLEDKATNLAKLKNLYEYRKAQEMLKLKDTKMAVDMKKSLVTAKLSEEGTYEEFITAELEFETLKSGQMVNQTRARIAQTLLESMTRIG